MIENNKFINLNKKSVKLNFEILPMYRTFRNRKVIILILFLVFATFLLSSISIILLHNNSIKNTRYRLTEKVVREKFFALSILKDNWHNEFHILEHLIDTLDVNRYGEVVFVRKAGDSIEFLMSPNNLSENFKMHQSSLKGTSFYRAIEKESGFMRDTDQNGVDVYAAFTYVDQLNWGIVAKIEAYKTNKPFIDAFIIVLFSTIMLVLVIAVVMFKVGNPIIDDLKRKEQLLIKAKEEVEESESQLIKAQKTAKTGNWIWYINDNKVWWSDEVYRIFDVDKATFTGKLDHIIENSIHPDDKKIVEESNLSVVNYNKPIPVEYRIIRNDGSYRYVYAIADEISYDKQGNKILTGIVKDISDFKEIQMELIKAKEMAEQSDRLKTAFLQNMSHEIRTPMNAIMGFAELLREDFDDREKLEKFTGIICQRSSDLLELINGILSVAQIESGQLPVNFSPCRLAGVLEEISVFFTEHQKKQSKTDIKFEIGMNGIPKDFQFYTDPFKLKQILINLIANAFKFTSNGFVKVGCKLQADNRLLFFVSDSGIGIPVEKKDYIFERFTQVEQNNGRFYGGTGLGLSIVKGLIDLLGGKIWVETELNKGTTFYFSLPGNTFIN